MFSTVKSRLNLLAFVPLIIFFCATFGLFQFHVRNLVVEDYLGHISGVLEIEARLIDNWLAERRRDIGTLAIALSGHTHSNAALKDRLTDFLPYQSEFYAAGFAAPDGRIRVRTDRAAETNISDRGFFQTATEGSAVISEPYLDPATDLKVITCAAPVYRDRDELLGVVFATLDLEKLQYLLQETIPGVLSDTYIVDITGTFLTEPLYSSVFTTAGGERYNPVLRANVSTRVFNAAAAHEELERAYSDYAGRSVFGDYRWINNGAWLLIGETRAANIRDRYSGYSSLLLIVLLVALALLFSVVMSLSKTIALPLRALEREMQQVKEEGASDLRPDWKIFERAPVEIRSLAYSFHTMEEQLAANMQALKNTTITDHLTRLYNRRHLFEEGYRYVHMIRRTHIPLACLMLDIDHFKAVNDTHGHAVGDQILREVSRQMRENIRETDFPARYGGEEFVILAYRAGKEEALQLAERLRSSIEELEHDTEAGRLSVTVSIGVSLLAEEQRSVHKLQNVKDVLDRLLRIADDALYEAKDSGRNQVCFGGEISDR